MSQAGSGIAASAPTPRLAGSGSGACGSRLSGAGGDAEFGQQVQHAALDLVDKVRRALLAIPDEPPARVEEEIDGALEQLVAGGLFMLCYPSGFVKHKRFFFVEPGSGDFIWCKPEAKPEPWPPVWAKTAFEAQRSEAIVKALDGVSHKREHIVGVSPRAPMVWPADCARAFIVTTDSTQLVLVASDEATKDVFVMGMYELLDREVRRI